MTPMIDRLAAHRTLANVPRPQLEWLASVGVERILEVGETLTPASGEPVRSLYVVLEGYLLIRVDRGAGPRIVLEWHGGDVTGMLPYSRIKSPPGSVIAEQRTEILAVDATHIPHMIRECHELTAVLVHVMLDRARAFKSSELLDEKVLSLGRLAAGLAHELNNPASAVARGAKRLGADLAALETATRRFCALNLSDAQCSAITALPPASTVPLTPIARADRQDALDEWLGDHALSNVDSEALTEAGIQVADLDRLATIVSSSQMEAVLAHESAVRATRQLAAEIDTAATRIHALVSAVKGFTYVNQEATLQPISIQQGLADTITVLRSKARAKSVTIDLQVANDLPTVQGFGGELNQVWANLLDNAIDAAPGGHVRIAADATADHVTVHVVDDGPGIPAELRNRIFDPFFTTKDVGQGTGLGLDIARRIVQRHRGAIDLKTGSGGTEFAVSLPRKFDAA